MDVYEYDYLDNYQLQDTCNLLQPFVFSVSNTDIPVLPSSLDGLCKDDSYMFLYDDPEKDPIQLPCKPAREFLSTSVKRVYYSEYNQDMVYESETLHQIVRSIESFIIPSYTLCKKHDLMIGSSMSNTALKYHTNTRKFLYVGGSPNGVIQVKMTPWKQNVQWLNEVRDYERGEYRSKINVWRDVETLVKHGVEFLEFSIKPGNILYIPPFWGYSLQYNDNNTYIVDFSYRTVLNTFAFSGEIGRTFLQQHNIYQKVYKNFLEKEPEEDPQASSAVSVTIEYPPSATEPLHKPCGETENELCVV
jgi:hypothetical protein